MAFITILDYLLLPFYLVIIYLIANNFQNAYYPPGHPWRPYFMSGLLTKLGGAFGIGMIYQYYYGGGDTANYFYHAQIINNAFSESPVKWFNLLMAIPAPYDPDYYTAYISKMYWYEAEKEYRVAAIAAFIGISNFTTYLPTALTFGALAFTGLWALFRTFATKYPHLTKQIAWSVLFIPSTVMWGSGLFKDTLCMGALGWLTYGVFRMLMVRDFRPGNVAMVILAFNLIAGIKVYILLAFIPALFLWILFTYSDKIPSKFTRAVVKIGVIGACLGGFVVFSSKFAEDLGKYSLENIGNTATVTATYIAQVSGDQGSAYSLGELDPSPAGMLKVFPAAVNVSLFRPYIWETRKPIQFLNAVEAAMFLFVTIKIFYVLGWKKVKKAVGEDPTIQFALIFTIIFAFAVGMSSGNFGTLSRYRIPCLPFFAITLVLIYHRYFPPSKNIMEFKK